MNTNKLFFFFCFVLLKAVQVAAQEGLTVPSRMRFADVELTIEPRTRDKIQQRVNQIAGNWTLYKELSERVKLYAPLITQVLREEGCPEDLQFMAMQLSGLTADATSPLKAGSTGFWMMSADIAKENGLQVDNTIDERKNIINSTRAFARAIQKSNYSLRNWVYATIAYQIGLSNAFSMIDRSRIGMSQLTIDEKTHESVIDLLSYTSVFRNQQNVADSPIQLLVYNETKGKSLDAIAMAAGVPTEQLRYYNSWLNAFTIPRNLPVYLPVPNERVASVSAALRLNTNQGFVSTASRMSGAEMPANNNPYPIISNRIDRRIGNKDFTFATINGISGMVAADGQSIDDLATAAGISKNKLIKFNDLKDRNAVLGVGQVLYLKPKKTKGPVKDHLTLPNESFWSVSQTYGITLNSLLKLNRIAKNEALQPGRVLLLQERRTKNSQPEYRELPPIHPSVIQNAPELQLDHTMTATDPNFNAIISGVHIVQPGESFYDIAKKYNVTITELRRWNGITDFTVTPGMELKIRGESLLPSSAVDTTTFIAGTVLTDSSLLPPPASDIDISATNDTIKAQPTHTVKAGENLYTIAMQYGLTTSNLRAWNNLPINAIIKPGDVLKLYDPLKVIVAGGAQQLGIVSGETQVVKHTVQRGETLTKIAAKYKTTVANIRAWNNLQTDAIAINQELIVSGPPIVVNAATPNTGTTIVHVMPSGKTSTSNPNQGNLHQIRFGESVEDIVKLYGINADDFYRWNNLPSGSTTFPKGMTSVYIADPALANSSSYNVTPQPYTKSVATGNTTNTNQPVITGNTGLATGTTPTQQAAATTPTPTYTVAAGETLFSISRKFHIPVSDLMRWNNMDMTTKLQLGQTILLQAPGSNVSVGTEGGIMLSNLSEPTGTIMRGSANVQASSTNPLSVEEARIYMSVPGDNIYDLANRFGIRLSNFKKWNNIPAGVFTLPVGTPIALNEAAATQVATMKAQAQHSAKGVIAQTVRPVLSQQTAKPSTTNKSSVIYHVVNKGETLFGIAKKYRVKVEQIKTWNKLQTDRVNAGTRLIISQ